MAQLSFKVVLILFTLSAALTRADTVDDYINSEMQRQHIQGLSLAVVNDGKAEKLAGYGQANVELNVPVTPKTVFQIQSITKTFTSTAVLMLVEEGKIALDDPVGKSLDATPPTWKNIKIRHLLSHTSGIKDFINEPTASLREDITEEEIFKATTPRPLNFQPGEKYAYSNTNYHLLAMIIRKLTGKSYGQFLKERIFDPLNMTDTRIMSWSDIIANRASGYQWRAGALHNGDYVAGSILAYGGGGILSTAPDMAKWALSLGTETFLKKTTIEKAWTATTLNNGGKSGYGLGWGIGAINGHRFVTHSGAHMTGFTSSLIHYRDDALTVIVLTNAGGADPTRIAQHIAGLYNPALIPALAKAIEDKDPKTTRLLRDISDKIKEGTLAADPFTPDMWKVISPQLKSLREQSSRDGDLKKVELLSHTESGSERTYRYRFISSKRTHLISAVFNGEGKISGLWIENE